MSFEAGECERRDVVESMRCCADVLLRQREDQWTVLERDEEKRECLRIGSDENEVERYERVDLLPNRR